MDSGRISKIQKARVYAEEPQRVTFKSFEVSFQGNHDTYRVTYNDGKWSCGCAYFAKHGICSHTMTMERLLGPMLKELESSA